MPASVKEYQMLETMTLLEGLASLWIGIMVVVSVMAGVMKADEYFYKRKRVRGLDAQRALFMAQRGSYQEYTNEMMRLSLNPAYAINNAMPMCTASRSRILTDLPRPEPMTRPTTVSGWEDAIPIGSIGPFIPWRSINETYQEQIKANEAAMERLAERAKGIPAPELFKRSPFLIQSIDPKSDIPIPGWDGTFIHFDKEVDDDRVDET